MQQIDRSQFLEPPSQLDFAASRAAFEQAERAYQDARARHPTQFRNIDAAWQSFQAETRATAHCQHRGIASRWIAKFEAMSDTEGGKQ